MARRTRRTNVDNSRADRMGTNVYSSEDNKSLHKSLNGEFILYQVLLDRLLAGKDSFKSGDINFLEYFSPSDKKDKETFIEFESKYKCSDAINWYTRETCIYKILNKALRTQNIDDIIPFQVFIGDLNQQLSDEHKSFIKKQKTSIIEVYRGQLISIDEVNRLKTSKGQLISMNSFLSTSTNKKKALEFATSQSPPNSDLTRILLEIDAPLDYFTKPFADIKHFSAFSEEEEILFMFGCVFRIGEIYFDEKLKLWIAKLTLCTPNEEDMKSFSSTLEKELKGQNPLIALGNYLMEMLKFKEAQEHYERVLEFNLTNDPIELAYCYHGLSNVNQKKGNYHSAIENINKSLDYLIKNLPKIDHPLISQCYNDLGSIYLIQKNYILAFQFYEKALHTINNIPSTTYSGLAQIHFTLENYYVALEYLEKSLEKQPPTAYPLIGNNYIDIGKVYSALNQKEKASKMFEKAIEVQLKQLNPKHPDFGYTYTAIGLMYSNVNDLDKAFEYIEKAYKLQMESLPNNHPDFAETFKNFGDLYMKKEDYDKALFYYSKALESQLKILLWNHPSVADTYLSIGHVHWKRKMYEKAQVYFHKVLDSELERKQIGDASLTNAYKVLGDLYFEKKDFDQALIFYRKSLENELETKLYPDLSLANIYETIASIYFKKRLLNQSLLYYNRLLDCYLQKQPFDESMVIQIYSKIGKVFLKKRNFNESLLYYEKLKDKSSFDTYRDIDNIHFEKRHLDQLLNYFLKFLNQQLKDHSWKDPLLADTYQILANIYLEKQNHDEALKYFLKLLENNLQRKKLEDQSLSNIYQLIGNIYFDKQNYNKSLTYFHRVIDCQSSKGLFHNPSITKTYQMIGNIYSKTDHLQPSSNYFIKLMENQSNRKINGENQSEKTNFEFEQRHLEQTLTYFQYLLNQQILKDFSLENIYLIIGKIYLEKQEFNQALLYFQQLLYYQINKNPLPNFTLAQTYTFIGDIYYRQGNSNHALKYYQHSLYLHQRIYPINQHLIDKIKHQIYDITHSHF